MTSQYCNDGRCSRTRDGEVRHLEHDLSIKKIKKQYALEGISVLFLLLGINYGLLSFTIDGLNQMEFAYKCVYDAVYANVTSDVYVKCSQDGINNWIKAYHLQIVSTILLAISAVIGLFRRRN